MPGFSTAYVPADGDTPTAAQYNQFIRDNLDYLEGSQAAQTQTARDVLVNAPGFECLSALFQAIATYTGASTGAQFRIRARVPSFATSQLLRLIGTVGEVDGGAMERLGLLEVKREGASGTGSLSLRTFLDGVLASIPAIRARQTGELGIHKSDPGYALDVGGTAWADGYQIAGIDIGKWDLSRVTPAIFSGTGLNDMVTGLETISAVVTYWVVKITLADTLDHFAVSSDDGESYGSPTAITAGVVVIDGDVSIQFGATTGHDGPLSALVFDGSGLDDLELRNYDFEGTGVHQLVVEIDGVGTPDTFKASADDGETWDEGIDITGVDQAIGDVTYLFNATTGHTLGDRWTATATELAAVWRFSSNPTVHVMRHAGKPDETPAAPPITDGPATVTGQLISTTTAGAGLRVSSRTLVTNLNVNKLGLPNGTAYGWPSVVQTSVQTALKSFTGAWVTLVSKATTRAGWHVVEFSGYVKVATGDDERLFAFSCSGGPGAYVASATAGDLMPVFCLGRYMATAGELLKVQIMCPDGASASSAAGFLSIEWYCPPTEVEA